MDDRGFIDKVLEVKIADLRRRLRCYSKVAVAFSGGVDSTVLLHNCCKTLGPDKVVALYARSCLQSGAAQQNVEAVFSAHFRNGCLYHPVTCRPLAWKDFVMNTQERCYFCKRHTFGLFVLEAQKLGCEVLFDGTNADDPQQFRPGLKAVQELGIVSPLLAAGLTKEDIRCYAREQGLINHDLPSNSCLATRIATGQPITPDLLTAIEAAEKFLASLGFLGVRVRPETARVCLELQESDIPKVLDTKKKEEIIQYFKQNGMGRPFVGLIGR